MVEGMELSAGAPDTMCPACMLGNMRSLPHQASDGIAAAPLELIHSDVCGPMSVESAGHARYFVTMLDDHSKLCAVVSLRQKSDAEAA